MRGATVLAVGGDWLFRWRGPVSGAVLIAVVAATHALAGEGWSGTFSGPAADGAGLLLVSAGLILRLSVVATSPPGTSGRNRTRQMATALNTTGPYSIVRHPLYLANLVAWAGVGVASGSWWIAAGTVMVGLGLYGPIMVAEDAFLARRFGDVHARWAARTPAIVPRFRRWVTPAVRIPWRALLRREYPSTVVISVAIYLVHMARAGELPDPGSVSTAWTVGLLVILAAASGARLFSRRAGRPEPSSPPAGTPQRGHRGR
jgi:protein-S-isoprenylcysteine O-methyltransferase Ste14